MQMKRTILVAAMVVLSAGARGDIVWTSPRTNMYFAKSPCGRIVVLQLKDGRFLWRNGIRHKGVVTTLASAETAAAVCP
jgi:hypothetical protein